MRGYVEQHPAERNHQRLGNELFEPGEDAGSVAGRIECRERLGGLLKYYHRRAARRVPVMCRTWTFCDAGTGWS